MSELAFDLDELSSAEDFLDYFEIEYSASVVHVNRLHILQRFHNYLTAAELPQGETEQRQLYRQALQQAYNDFVHSDAQTEKVFKVFQMAEGTATVPLERLGRGEFNATSL
ncbi:nitrogen fixation protein NifW [Ectothiorhodospiraceae bacterium BW-2]|nr:nitrogen fixation protein NifW [Ectothiorhodospiraceae bacterium BW-2]